MQSSSRLLLPQTRREDPMEKLTSERARERGLVSRGAKEELEMERPEKKWRDQKWMSWRSQNWLRGVSNVMVLDHD